MKTTIEFDMNNPSDKHLFEQTIKVGDFYKTITEMKGLIKELLYKMEEPNLSTNEINVISDVVLKMENILKTNNL